MKAEKSITRPICTRWRSFEKIEVPVFPMPLQQDAKVFSAQGILSSGVATNVVVFMHLLVDVLRK